MHKPQRNATIYFEVVDYAVSSIQDRFDQPGFKAYKNLEELLVKATNKQDYSTELEEVVKMILIRASLPHSFKYLVLILGMTITLPLCKKPSSFCKILVTVKEFS